MMLWALLMGFLVAKPQSKAWRTPLPATQSTSVPEGTAKLRVDAYLSQIFPQYSRSQVGDLCELGAVMVNDTPKAKNYKVKGGDAIAFEVAR
jgi:23S rRNA-/tRNA-specific pseudouridylate synthase